MARALLSVFATFLVLASIPVLADNGKYTVTINGQIQQYDKLEDAENAIRSGPPPSSQLKRLRTELDEQTGQVFYHYGLESNEIPPEPAGVIIFPSGSGSNPICSGPNGQWCYSESGFLAVRNWLIEEAGYCLESPATATGSWTPNSWALDSNVSVDGHELWLSYAGRSFSLSYRKTMFGSTECGETVTEASGPFSRYEGYDCPEGFDPRVGTGGSSGYCYSGIAFVIKGPPGPTCNAGSASGGNPCDILTGNKRESETDYAGKHLTLTRTFNSSGEKTPDELPFGWTHNYAARLVTKPYFSVTVPIFYISGNGSTVHAYGSGTTIRQLAGRSGEVLIRNTSDNTWTLQKRGSREVFDADGRLLRIEERGQVTNLSYDSVSGLLSTVTDPFGNTLQFSYTDGRLTGVTRPDGEQISYQYANDNLVGVTYPGGSSRQYHYERADYSYHLTGITDENGDRFSTFTYDSAGMVTGSEHAGGVESFSIQRNSNGTIVTTDDAGHSAVYQYSAVRHIRMLGSVDSPCASCSNNDAGRTYDTNGRVTGRTGFDGTQTTYQRGSYGVETSRTEAAGTPKARTITTQWDYTSLQPTKITEPGRTVDYTYDTNGNRLTEKVTDTATSQFRTTTWTYNTQGQVLTVDGPRTDVTDVTTYTYDTDGNLATVTNALSHLTQYTDYDAHGNPLEIIDPNGIVTRLTYDLRQRVKTRTVAYGTADAATTSFDYDLVGQLIKTTLPDGSWIEYEYDDAHRMTAIEDSAGNRIDYVLDAMGNRTTETVSGPGAVTFRSLTRSYNTLNRLVSETTPENDTVSYTYDAEGKRETVTDADSNVTTSHYDALDRLFETIDALTGTTSYGYDARDNLTQVVDPRGVTTSYSYNGFNELTQTASPDAGTTSYTYDKAGNRVTQTDARGITASYSYDALNRLTEIDYPGTAQDITYQYDAVPNAIGRLTVIEDETGRTEYAYDTRGNLESKASQVSGTWLPLSYGHDIADRLDSITYPDGSLIDYQRDAHGRITGITLTPPGGTAQTVVNGISYAPFGPVTNLTFGNGIAETRSYDQAGRIDTLTSSVLALDYTWDATNNITAITDSLDATRSQTFDYDALYRLTDASGVYGDLEWSYDTVGNRLSQTVVPAQAGTPETLVYTYATTSNRLDTITDANGTVTYQYDANGNITDDGDNALSYDDRNRFTAAVDPSTQQTLGSYGHNALGQRVIKTVNGVTTLFAYDEAGHLLGEYDATGNPLRQYVWFDDRPVAMLVPNVTAMDVHYIHSDHLNTPKVVTDGNQQVVWKGDYRPFGETTETVTTVDMNLRFPGQYEDEETSLSYNYFRSYSSVTGRYTQSDPVGLHGGLNVWGYAEQSPTVKIDVNGLMVTPRADLGRWNCLSTGAVECLFRNTGQEIEEAAEAVKCDLKCSTACTIGFFIGEVRDKVAQKAASAVAERVAKDVVKKWLLRGIPVVGQVSTVISAGLTVSCVTNCWAQ